MKKFDISKMSANQRSKLNYLNDPIINNYTNSYLQKYEDRLNEEKKSFTLPYVGGESSSRKKDPKDISFAEMMEKVMNKKPKHLLQPTELQQILAELTSKKFKKDSCLPLDHIPQLQSVLDSFNIADTWSWIYLICWGQLFSQGLLFYMVADQIAMELVFKAGLGIEGFYSNSINNNTGWDFNFLTFFF